MAGESSTTLQVSAREAGGSRAARRLRRSGRVPGILYGGDGDSLSFDVDARDLRLALAASGAVVELRVGGSGATHVVVKEAQRDPVRGETVHIDLLRVRLDREISAVVALELDGAEGAPGVRQGGVLEHVTRELNVEALPTAIPEAIVHDVSSMEIGETVTLAAVVAPAGVKLLDDGETVIAILSPPRLQSEITAEIESETELVGDGGEAEPAGGQEDSGGEG
ncbi:MAG: 50S ribosomal protein L25 [Solirubrobacteraceae bacterium]